MQENGLKQSGLLNIPITKDTPSFVSWNWPLIRKCTFFLFMSSLLAMCALVVAMIIMLPKTCNPRYKISFSITGSQFYNYLTLLLQDKLVQRKRFLWNIPGEFSRFRKWWIGRPPRHCFSCWILPKYRRRCNPAQFNIPFATLSWPIREYFNINSYW